MRHDAGATVATSGSTKRREAGDSTRRAANDARTLWVRRRLALVVAVAVALSSATIAVLHSRLPSRTLHVISHEQRISLENVLSPRFELPSPNLSLPPVSIGACCGIGHRLSRTIPTMVYAVRHSRLVHANWEDITWNVLFNDTLNIKQGPKKHPAQRSHWYSKVWCHFCRCSSTTMLPSGESYDNDFPSNWTNLSLALTEREQPILNTAYRDYGITSAVLFELPLAQYIVKSLAQNLSPLVLSFLTPLRLQYTLSDLHLCAHVREGNNEKGDWENKTWRHLDLYPVLNSTLVRMGMFARSRNATAVSLFVASDNKRARSWFEENAPENWRMVKPAKELRYPESGVWFGEYGSNTNENLTQPEKDEAMAEAVADVFALGECDALFIPSYSSFSIVGIMLTRAKRKTVFFRGGYRWEEHPENIKLI